MTAPRYKGLLTEPGRLAERLECVGFDSETSREKAELLVEAASVLERGGAGGDRRAYYAPGRIEVLGKHTDYAGGSSVIAAAQRGFFLAAAPRTDSLLVITDAKRRETRRFAVEPELVPAQGDWSNYPMTVARRIARNFPGATRGADMAMASDLPPAAGLSSSSALLVAVFLALADVNRLDEHPRFPEELKDAKSLAGYLGTIENGRSYGALEGDRGVGTLGGSEDHTAILCSAPGRIRQYAYLPVRLEKDFAAPRPFVFAIASSGVAAEKIGAARERYNRASQLADAIVELWRRETGRADPHLAAAIRSGPTAAEDLRRWIASSDSGRFDRDALSRRLEHFLVENERVIPAAGAAMERGDWDEFGRVVDQSQDAADKLLGNQIPETRFLAAAARRRGAAAASAFGAGFGGSVWALIEASRAAEFLDAWRDDYRSQFPRPAERAEFFCTAAGPAARRVA